MINKSRFSFVVSILLLFPISEAYSQAAQDVTIRQLNTYENLTDPSQINAHPLAGVLVKFTGVIISYPRNSGLASYTAGINSIGRIHMFVVDTNAASTGLDGQYMQVVDASNMPVVEQASRGDMVTIEGRLSYFAAGTGFTVMFATTTVSIIGNVLEDFTLQEYQSLLEPTVVSVDEINMKLPDGSFSHRLDSYTKYINRYVKVEGTTVVNSFQAPTGRPWMYVGDENVILPTTDTSLRFRNDRTAGGYRTGYNYIRPTEDPFSPPLPGAIVDISGFIVMNAFNVNNTGANTYKIAPWDDGVVWVSDGEVSPSYIRSTPEGWPNDLVIVPPVVVDIELGLVAHYLFTDNSESETEPSIGGTAQGGYYAKDRFGYPKSSKGLNGQTNDLVYTSTQIADPQEFTLSSWFNVSEGTGGNFLSFTSSPIEISFQWDRLLGIDSSGKIRANVFSEGEAWLISENRYDNDAWNHAVATLGSNGFNLFVNGALVASNPAVTSAESRNGYWRIGGLVYSGSNAFTGLLDDIRIYNRALSAAEVAALYELESTLPALNQDEITDIDGIRYKTVRIGDQVWMAENLRTLRYQDGSLISNVTDGSIWSQLTTGSWVHYNNDQVLGETYGKLYNWYAVADERNMCPVGWEVPSYDEWTQLISYLGTDTGLKMKSDADWSGSGSGTDESGFSGLPGGIRSFDGTYSLTTDNAFWWSSSEGEGVSAWYWGLGSNSSGHSWGEYSQNGGMSVRCIRSKPKASSDTWTLPIRATTSTGLASVANLGVSPSGSDGLDSLDVPAPPTPPGAHIQLFTDRPEWNSPLGRRVGTDIKESVDLSAVPTSWTVYLSSSDAASGELVLDRPTTGLNWPIVVLKGNDVYLSRYGDLILPFNFAAGGSQSFSVHVGDTTAPKLQIGDWFEGPAIFDASAIHPLDWQATDANHVESFDLNVSHNGGVTWDSLYTGTEPAHIWAPDPNIVFNDSTLFGLTATDRAGNWVMYTTMSPISVMAPRQPVTRPQGWSLSGSPLINPNDVTSALGEAFRFVWNGAGYEQVLSFATGRGQWTGAVAAITDTLGGTVATQSQFLSLPAGWNLVSSPLLRSIYADSMTVTHTGNGRSLPLPAAIDSNWVTTPLGYTGSAYAASARIEPFDGYWLGVLVPSVTVDLPIHAYSTVVAKEISQQEPMVRMLLKDGESEQIVSVKQGVGVPAPPPAPNGERSGLKGLPTLLGDLYLVAGANPNSESTWPLVIGGEARTVELSWTDQSFTGMTAVLQLADRRYDLTRAGSIALRSDEPVQIIVGPISTSTEPGSETPMRTELMAAYPNPFNPSTQIRFTLDAGRQTRLAVYDMLGREVAVLINGSLSAGTHQVTFDASGLASGVYIYRLETTGRMFTRRMTLVK